MTSTLNETEVRVLGSLIEKETTTPEYYPLTVNALTNACNQKNNRDPVLSLEEAVVIRTLDALREKKLVFQVTGDGIRVPKYKQALTESLKLSQEESAAMCVLMLRGAQTAGELRTRTGPLHPFRDLAEIQPVLDHLMDASLRSPLVAQLPRRPGQKEIRFIHLLSGDPGPEPLRQPARPDAAQLQSKAENDRIATLETEVAALTRKVDDLEKLLADFRKQFE